MKTSGRDSGQLDVPLVWEVDPIPPAPEQLPGDPFPRAGAEPAPFTGLLQAALVDGGLALLVFGVLGLLVVVQGVDLDSRQVVAVGVAGLEVLLVLVTGALWGWRGTPGMVMVGMTFGTPLVLGRAVVVAAVWLFGVPVLALPLLVGRRGSRPLERLAGTPVSSRSPRVAV
jgi:hypothetical protein